MNKQTDFSEFSQQLIHQKYQIATAAIKHATNKMTEIRLYLWEVPNKMRTMTIHFGKHIKQEWFHVEVQSFVVEKQLCQ